MQFSTKCENWRCLVTDPGGHYEARSRPSDQSRPDDQTARHEQLLTSRTQVSTTGKIIDQCTHSSPSSTRDSCVADTSAPSVRVLFVPYWTRCRTSSQCSCTSKCSRCDRHSSNFRVPLTKRASAFSTCILVSGWISLLH